jgi:DNA invertase Pin-like site-specific DNA recombinase
MSTSALTRRALQAKKRRGEKTGGKVPYGYRLAADGATLEPHPVESKVVEAVKRLKKRGLSYRRIEAELQEAGFTVDAGYTTRRGGPINYRTVGRILTYEVAK